MDRRRLQSEYLSEKIVNKYYTTQKGKFTVKANRRHKNKGEKCFTKSAPIYLSYKNGRKNSTVVESIKFNAYVLIRRLIKWVCKCIVEIYINKFNPKKSFSLLPQGVDVFSTHSDVLLVFFFYRYKLESLLSSLLRSLSPNRLFRQEAKPLGRCLIVKS